MHSGICLLLCILVPPASFAAIAHGILYVVIKKNKKIEMERSYHSAWVTFGTFAMFVASFIISIYYTLNR